MILGTSIRPWVNPRYRIIGRKSGTARASTHKAKGDEKFKICARKLAEAMIANITGTDIFRLSHDRPRAFSALSVGFFSLAVISEKANCMAPRKDNMPSLIVSSSVKSAKAAGPINLAKVMLNAKFAKLAILAEMNKAAAGPKNFVLSKPCSGEY